MEDIKALMREKIDILNKAAKAYYVDGEEIMSNLDYDRIYDELSALEKESGIVLAGSPTQQVGYEVLSDLPKERHPSKMLSLDKTKSREELKDWLGNQKGVLSWKLDGLTIVLTYRDGKLFKAVTRGNGEIGEVVTNNARVFKNLPLQIAYKGDLVLRGEAIITYKDFEKINDTLGEAAAKYKNPRNLCSGSVRQLNNRITAERNVRFYTFALVSAENVDFKNSRDEQFRWLKEQGFDVVEHKMVTSDTILDEIQWFEDHIENNPVPSDGLVLLYDDIAYGESLGTTTKFPRDAIAFKWRDQMAETTLEEIQWNASRTGLINPVAVFDPVELEGTTVSRASLHNLSIARELKLGIGDKILVYKANMIIPQVADNLTKSDNIVVPAVCPVCGSPTRIDDDEGVQTVICPNPKCLAKQIKSFTLFVSRDAMNIEGLSEMTIEKLIGRGFVKEFADLFRIADFRDEFVEMEGFGEKSFENLKASVEKARHTTPARLLYALGVPGIGSANANLIASYCRNKWSKMMSLTKEELTSIDGIGEVMADNYLAYLSNPEKKKVVDDLVAVLDIDETAEEKEDFFDGMTFVITGSLETYQNRNELKKAIESAGGKVAGSVSKNTSYLINNDVHSTSGKNKKAHELGVKIIDEATIRSWLENKGVK